MSGPGAISPLLFPNQTRTVWFLNPMANWVDPVAFGSQSCVRDESVHGETPVLSLWKVPDLGVNHAFLQLEGASHGVL